MLKANINNSQQELLSCCFCNHVSPNINMLRLLPCRYVTCVSLFNLRHHRDFTLTHPEGEPCIYVCVFFTLRHFFLFRPRVFPRALRSVAHGEPARTSCASFGPRRGPCHVLLGLKLARLLGEAFRARKAIQAHANPHVHNTLLTG